MANINLYTEIGTSMIKYYAGIDIGSTMTKAVIISGEIVASFVSPSVPEHQRLALDVMKELLAKAGLRREDVKYIVATGYGRVNVPFADKQITEISCHAKAAAYLLPQARTVIDVGGQDCKAIKLNSGKVVDFVMNDKCAAGTGRFIEVIAESLGVKLDEIGELSLTSQNEIPIANTCTVFAEREVVAKLTEGVPVADLVAGIHAAIATRIYGMAARIRIEREVAVSGGGAKNIGLVSALEKKMGFSVIIPPEPLLMGAIGAAFLAREFSEKL
jgi:predicted CoA-substrate-specific enzyme activase